MGFDPDSFWRQTPRIFDLVVSGYVEARRHDHNHDVTVGYMTAMLGRMKKPPALASLLSTPKPEKGKRKNWRELLKVAEALTKR